MICPICKKTFAKNPEKVANIQSDTDVAKNNLNKVENTVCEDCKSGFAGLWAFGWREGVLKKLIEQYKYQSVRAMSDVLAELLDVALPVDLPQDVVVVPLPTIGRHIRERGFDHTMLLAKKLAKRRNWQVQRILMRTADTVQVGAKVAEREEQAKRAYGLNGEINKDTQYLLLDDVWTTGASMLAALSVLKNAGAQTVYGVVLGVSKPKPIDETAKIKDN